jgi:hypothetical protein
MRKRNNPQSKGNGVKKKIKQLSGPYVLLQPRKGKNTLYTRCGLGSPPFSNYLGGFLSLAFPILLNIVVSLSCAAALYAAFIKCFLSVPWFTAYTVSKKKK